MLLFLKLVLPAVLVHCAPILLGQQVFALSERVLEIRGFVYDGAAPDVFFWADTNSSASAGGFILSDLTPSNSCGTRPLPPPMVQ